MKKLPFLISPFLGVPDILASTRLAGIISIRDPKEDARSDAMIGETAVPILRLSFHDVSDVTTEEARQGVVAVSRKQIDDAAAFAQKTKPTSGKPILIHCEAGISRSPSLAFGLACLMQDQKQGLDLFTAIRIAEMVGEAATVWDPNRDVIRGFQRLLDADAPEIWRPAQTAARDLSAESAEFSF